MELRPVSLQQTKRYGLACPADKHACADSHARNSKLAELPLNAHRNLCGVSFGRKLAEHKSWGASVDPVTKDVNFKTHSFHGDEPVRAVYVEIKDYEKYDKRCFFLD